MNELQRNFKNPWPRMAMACVLTVWSGANLWSNVFRWKEIVNDDFASRSMGLFMSIMFVVLPMVVAIYLFWTVVVGPEDPVASGAKNRSSSKKSEKNQVKSAKRKNR